VSRVLIASLIGWAWFQAAPGADAVQVVKDLAYRPADEPDVDARQRCKLDLYLPAQAKSFPTLVWFHGGGLESGGRSGEGPWATSLARSGMALAVVDYRLSPKATYPAYIQDAALAVAYVHREIAARGGDPKRVFIGGHSAGGYLTAMLVLDPRWLTAAGMEPAEVAGAVPVSGQMITHSTVRKERGISRDVEVVDDAAPLSHARAPVPPIFFVTADNDMKGRGQENRRMHEALVALGNTNLKIREFAGRTHGTIKSAMSNEDDPARKALVEFVLSGK
jgi:acetyl esterase/lipase